MKYRPFVLNARYMYLHSIWFIPVKITYISMFAFRFFCSYASRTISRVKVSDRRCSQKCAIYPLTSWSHGNIHREANLYGIERPPRITEHWVIMYYPTCQIHNKHTAVASTAPAAAAHMKMREIRSLNFSSQRFSFTLFLYVFFFGTSRCVFPTTQNAKAQFSRRTNAW